MENYNKSIDTPAENFEQTKKRMEICVEEIDKELFCSGFSSNSAITRILEEDYGITSYLYFVLEKKLDQINSVRRDTERKEFSQEEYQAEVARQFQNYIQIVSSPEFTKSLNLLEIKRDLDKIRKIIKQSRF